MEMRRYICEIDALLNDIRFFSFPIVKFLPTGWMDGWISSYPSFPLILQINSLLGRKTGYLFGQWNMDGYHFEGNNRNNLYSPVQLRID